MGWIEPRDAVLAEVDALTSLVDGLSDDDLARPARCPGWTAGHAVRHVAETMAGQQEAFTRMLAGSAETPPYVDPDYDGPEVARQALAESAARARDVLPQLGDEHADRPVPLPFGTFPSPTALDIILLEYGVHRWDIADAVSAGAEMSPAAADGVLRLMPAFIAFFSTPPPADPIGYRLDAPSATIEVSPRDGAWHLEAGDAPATVVQGSDSAVALFALGRIGGDDERLTVSGDDAGDFKRWFPGP